MQCGDARNVTAKGKVFQIKALGVMHTPESCPTVKKFDKHVERSYRFEIRVNQCCPADQSSCSFRCLISADQRSLSPFT